MRAIDAERLEVGDRHVAEHVVAERVDHRDLGAEQAGHDRLVRALAAEAELEVVTLDRLAGRRDPGRVGDEVDHRAPDDGDARLVCHWARLPTTARIADNGARYAARQVSSGRSRERGDLT